MSIHTRTRTTRQRGFALVVLLIVVAAAGAAVAGYVASRARPELPGKLRAATDAVRMVTDAVEEAYLRGGAFPADLGAALGTASRAYGLAGADPYTSRPLDYQIIGSQPAHVRVRSVGPDRVLGTADDIVREVNEQVVGRARTVARLRILRAVYFKSPLCAGTVASPTARTTLLTSMRAYTLAQKQLLYLNDAPHVTVRNQAATTLTNDLSQILAVALLPVPVTGPGGLLEQLGLPDWLGIDGFGNTFYASAVGVSCAGGDRTVGTDDDF